MVGDWNGRASAARSAAADAWAPVLEWELVCGRPQIVVTVGRRAQQMLDRLITDGMLPDPAAWGAVRCEVPHYVSITARPDNARGRPPNDPERVDEYLTLFRDLATRRDSLRFNVRAGDGRERFLGSYAELRVVDGDLRKQFAYGSGMGRFSCLDGWRPLDQPGMAPHGPAADVAREATELLAQVEAGMKPATHRVLGRLTRFGDLSL